VLCGLSVAAILRAELGAAPWDVLHQGIERHTGIPVGTVIILVGFVLVAAVLPFGVRPGLGTVLNAVLIGATVDAVMALSDSTGALAVRIPLLAAGIVGFGAGTAVYLGVALGAGPRDGLMTTIVARGPSVRVARTAIEIVVVVLGVLLGGSIGVGTAAFALAIGPTVQWFMPRFALRPPQPAAPSAGAIAPADT
jgi:uncharacterized membrane protein YczE